MSAFVGKFPDGEITHSRKKYLEAWDSLTSQLKQFYGLQCYAFDPSVQCHTRLGAVVDLPVSLALQMVVMARLAQE